jgi:hypothetical protein
MGRNFAIGFGIGDSMKLNFIVVPYSNSAGKL